MKILKKLLAAGIVLAVLTTALYVFVLSPRRVVPILMYHGIREGEASSMYVSPKNFDRQMMFLKKQGYSVISLDELVRGIENGKGYIPRTVVITFDDGYRDNYLSAFPVLAKYGFPATIFLVTGYAGNEEYLTWDQVNIMRSNGIAFGSHTMNNVYLPSETDTTLLWKEISGSRRDIERSTGEAPKYFAYPIGGFNSKVKAAVKMAGYKGACTTNRGSDRYNKDVFELNRIKITNSDTVKPFHFRAKLSGFYNLFRKLKSPE
ncbi:MAG: polysaccharide deacetylase family protein [Candidatus Omnitrophota bacterium]